jgi:cell volume regulation protein A
MELNSIELLPLFLAVAGLVLAAAVLGTRLSMRAGIPTAIAFLALGVVLGTQQRVRDVVVSYDAAYAAGNIALALILFYGGLCTDLRRTRGIWAPSIVLATVGVVGVSLLTAFMAYLLLPGFRWDHALILGAVLGSTDAASVLQILAGERIAGKVRETVELESGLNDPMAFVLVASFTAIAAGDGWSWTSIPMILWQLVAGAAIGAGIGWIAGRAMDWFAEESHEVYPAMTIALALLSYGVASLAQASGLLAVFITALVLGNLRGLPYRGTLVRFHGALAYMAQILMFIVLGVLVQPKQLLEPQTLIGGTVLAIVLALVARPVVVSAILLPFGFTGRETAAIAWLGLRGAVPIILMTIPILVAADDPDVGSLQPLFNAVFICVLVGSFIPGATVRWVLRLLRLRLPPAPRPSATIDIITKTPLDTSLMMLVVQPGAPVAGKTLAQAGIPGDVTVALLVRGSKTERVRGDTRFEVGDEVALSVPERTMAAMRALFGEDEE